MLQPGESLDGYRVIRLIGSGGFGAVWLCQSEALGDYRALKFIPDIDPGRIQKEFDALCRYRTAAGQLRSPSIMPIEHVNRRSDGLYYIMPLADGYGSSDPLVASWCPLTLAAVIEIRRGEPTWFTSEEVKGYITPILNALQLLSDAGLVHRDVKPDNILFLNGSPCLGDISLLGQDAHNITRRGTPGYSAPSWFVESGGQPDMYGAATTLYSLLTGNPPDKMGRSAFRWPPQGEGSLSAAERQVWLRIHRIIRRAANDQPAERFLDFSAFSACLLSLDTAATAESSEGGFDEGGSTALEVGKPETVAARRTGILGIPLVLPPRTVAGYKSCIAGFFLGILGLCVWGTSLIGFPLSLLGLALFIFGLRTPPAKLSLVSLAWITLNTCALLLTFTKLTFRFWLELIGEMSL